MGEAYYKEILEENKFSLALFPLHLKIIHHFVLIYYTKLQ